MGIIPGYRHFAYNAFASAGTGGAGVNYDYPGAILASHSGPSLYEVPQVIHPPNSPLGHTDEFYSLHPGGANVLMGDGSVRFIKQSINLLAWQAMSSRLERRGDQCRLLLIDRIPPRSAWLPLAPFSSGWRDARRLRRGADPAGGQERPGVRGAADGRLAEERERTRGRRQAHRRAARLGRALRRKIPRARARSSPRPAKDWGGAEKQAYEFRAQFGDRGSFFN